ncbi:class I adenylate-forming enzyme family protein [Candidatus Poriferisodalis sp.]|uniref:class I adenylate-forming enzyme family protein n=1 Tax=Candidatus Poriferisodalis sp. TaxID=3101277 RepID=UPI003B02EA83
MNVAELLERAPDGDAVVLIDRSAAVPRHTTAAQMSDRVLRLGTGLLARGMEPSTRVGLLAANCGEYYDVMFGAPAAGLVFVPLNTRLPADSLSYILDDADVHTVIADAEHAPLVPPAVPSIVIGSAEWDALCSHEPLTAPAAVDDDDIAVHIYTSGSTGRPKGVLLTHRNITFTVLEYGAAMPGEVMLVSAPLYHKNASMSSKLAFASGGTVVLLPQFSAASYVEAIEQHRVTMCSGVPTMFALVTAEIAARAAAGHELPDLSSVQRAFIGSAPLTEALHDDVQRLLPQAVVSNGYGTTEAVLAFGPHPDGTPRPAISVGHQHPSVELRLVDPDTGADADAGELWVRSPGVMAGYHRLPEATAERLTDGWYHTGDLMTRDDDGWYYFVGRVDDMFVCAGENIYPDAVEQLLERHPAVHQAVVVPVPDELKGQLPAAFVRLAPGSTLTVEDVKQYALANGPAYAHPRYVWFIDEIPLASTAKIDRRGLIARAAELAPRRQRPPTPPRAPAAAS